MGMKNRLLKSFGLILCALNVFIVICIASVSSYAGDPEDAGGSSSGTVSLEDFVNQHNPMLQINEDSTTLVLNFNYNLWANISLTDLRNALSGQSHIATIVLYGDVWRLGKLPKKLANIGINNFKKLVIQAYSDENEFFNEFQELCEIWFSYLPGLEIEFSNNTTDKVYKSVVVSAGQRSSHIDRVVKILMPHDSVKIRHNFSSLYIVSDIPYDLVNQLFFEGSPLTTMIFDKKNVDISYIPHHILRLPSLKQLYIYGFSGDPYELDDYEDNCMVMLEKFPGLHVNFMSDVLMGDFYRGIKIEDSIFADYPSVHSNDEDEDDELLLEE
jgi:hypothetical protein